MNVSLITRAAREVGSWACLLVKDADGVLSFPTKHGPKLRERTGHTNSSPQAKWSKAFAAGCPVAPACVHRLTCRTWKPNHGCLAQMMCRNSLPPAYLGIRCLCSHPLKHKLWGTVLT